MGLLRPYLVRAIYDWVVDSGLTPYMLVDAEVPDVTVPSEFIQDGKIILNISSNAVRDLDISNDWVTFNARFSGVSMEVSMPPNAILALYAKENGRGMVFSDYDEETQDSDPEPPGGNTPSPSGGRPNLRVVK